MQTTFQRFAYRLASRAIFTLCAGFPAMPGLASAQTGPQHLRAITLGAGIHLIQSEVAMSPAEREVGLMNRRDLATNQGMIFVLERPGVQCFWMKNTILPLTAAFVADDGTIVNLADMKPQTTDSHCSTKPVRFVLEMNQGWFAKKGIKAGFKLGGKPFEAR